MVANNKHYGDDEGDDVAYSKATRNRMSRSVNIAKSMFSKGVTSNGRTFNVTFAYNKSKLLAIGVNNYHKIIRYIPSLDTDFKRYGEVSYVPSCHGEISCLLKLGLEDCSNLDFFSVRIDKNNKCCCSKPCLNCEAILKQVGFKHVWYFDREMKMKTL